MADAGFNLIPLGSIRTGFLTLGQCPSTGRLNPGESAIEIAPEHAEALTNIELVSHLLVLYWLDRADRTQLLRRPRPGEVARGVFASRSPSRPNPLGLSVVKLLERDGNRLRVSGLDCLDGTPIVDIKPYVPDDDRVEDARIGWETRCTKRAAPAGNPMASACG